MMCELCVKVLSYTRHIHTTTIIQTMDNGERGMNPVAMTIIISLERILAEPADRTSDLLFKSLTVSKKKKKKTQISVVEMA